MSGHDLSAADHGDGDAADPSGAAEEATPAREPRPRDRFGRPLPRDAIDEMADAEEPDEVVASLDEAFERAVELFDAQRFFEAHEFFEHIWKSDWIEPSDKDFWKGVTQVAVGCCHVQRGNDTGALSLLQRAVHYLSGYPAHHRGVDVTALVGTAEEVAGQVRRHGASPDLTFAAFPR